MSAKNLEISPAHIEFWFEFASNYSYLSVMRIEAAASRHGVQVHWRPFLLGPIFRSLGWTNSPFVLQKAKGDYVWKDMIRQCAKHGLPWQKPTEFPRSSLLPLRVALLGAEQSWGPDFCREIMMRNFVDNLEIDTSHDVSEVLKKLNLPHEQIINDALSEGNKLKLWEQTQTAVDKGIFGAPTFFVGAEMFWGDDRLDDALTYCVQQAVSTAAV